MKSLLINIVVMVVILGSAFWFTHWFAKAMYNRCSNCGTLNARRRTRCRVCGTKIE